MAKIENERKVMTMLETRQCRARSAPQGALVSPGRRRETKGTDILPLPKNPTELFNSLNYIHVQRKKKTLKSK